MIDLHAHTTASDGSLPLEELVIMAARGGLRALAVTDHDNVQSARRINGREPLEVIPGIELSVFDHALGYEDVHVIGLFIDPKHETLNSKLDSLGREEQKKATVAKLNELGYEITYDEVKAKSQGVVGRPHIAMVLMEKYPSEFPKMADVFNKLLGRGQPACIGRESGFGLGEAIALIHAAGGLAILCHPFIYPYDADALASKFKGLGGDGIEVYYDYAANRPSVPTTPEENARLMGRAKELAGRFGLLESGGSDFHGQGKRGYQELGIFGAPDEVLAALKAARGKPL
ncbi:PHP domain-containing protein [Candidatus Micrarchaeota archaeon]|nr:PHP domain-containing protein [Candidatus Micrarchaeota archaeon]